MSSTPNSPPPTEPPTEPGAEPSVGPQAEQRRHEGRYGVPEPDEQIAELEGRWLRAVAELDTMRRRMAQDAVRQRAEERAAVAAQWLPVLDNLELALKHSNAGSDAVIEGVRAVRDQAIALLSRLGFPRYEDVGEEFDPARHEAVAVVRDADAPPGTVVDVVRPGYGDGERQLRPAAVVVAAMPPTESAAEGATKAE